MAKHAAAGLSVQLKTFLKWNVNHCIGYKITRLDGRDMVTEPNNVIVCKSAVLANLFCLRVVFAARGLSSVKINDVLKSI
jgi:hypothetical protein